MPGITWDSKLAAVAGQHAKKIEKAFGYTTVGELLQHYPRRYVPRDKLSKIDSLVVDDHVTVLARVADATQHPYRDRRTGRMAFRLEVLLETDGADLTLTFFDRAAHTAKWRENRPVLRQGRTVPEQVAAHQPADDDVRLRGGRRGARARRARDAPEPHPDLSGDGRHPVLADLPRHRDRA